MGFFRRKENAMEYSVLSQTMQALHASDQRLLQLLTLRRQLAMRLAQASLASAAPATPEERASAVVSRLAPRNPGPLDEARLTSLFATVIMLTEPLFTSISARNGGLKKG
jgi:chorismate mutase